VSGQKESIGLDKHIVTPSTVVEEETTDQSTRREGHTSESDESDVSTAKTKDDAIISKDSSQISTEAREYSDNRPSKNEKTMKENEEIASHSPSEDTIEATHDKLFLFDA
jgi:hypothetical protein